MEIMNKLLIYLMFFLFINVENLKSMSEEEKNTPRDKSRKTPVLSTHKSEDSSKAYEVAFEGSVDVEVTQHNNGKQSGTIKGTKKITCKPQ